MYRVEDKDENVSIEERIRLRLRKRHVICCAHASDDKKHGRFAMQHFLSAKLE